MDFTAQFEVAVGEMDMTPDYFWSLTYAEFEAKHDGYIRRMQQKEKDMIFISWHTAAFMRQRELPTLAELLNDKPQKAKTQTPEEMITAWKMIIAVHGGQVVEV